MCGLIKAWELHSTKEEYLASHKLSDVKCFKCGSTKTLDVGLTNMVDNRRTIHCARCKVTLYREED
ncbi:hypothetical protein ACUY4Q_001984 [Phytobacter sp. AG2a]|jgi:hypothetical protein